MTPVKKYQAYNDLTNEQLAVAAKEDSYAFNLLFYRLNDGVKRIFKMNRVPAEDHDDLAQRVWLRVTRNIGNYDPTKRFEPWIFIIARNVAFNYWRDLRNNLTLTANAFGDRDEDNIFLYLADRYSYAEAATETFQHRDLLEKLEKALETNATGNKELKLFLKGLSYADIAEIQKVKVNTVKSRISRARNNLRTIRATV